MTDTLIDIIRHGEPEGGRRYRGHGVDDPLSESGWQQMRHAVADRFEWQQIVSSPLSRCRAFAEEQADQHNIPLSIEDSLKEIGFGVWEGRTPEDIIANDGDALERFTRDPVHNRPQGAEPLHDFADRVWATYTDIARKHTGQKVLIVAHAGVIRAIVSHILSMPLDDVYSRLKIDYAAIASTRISTGRDPVLTLRA